MRDSRSRRRSRLTVLAATVTALIALSAVTTDARADEPTGRAAELFQRSVDAYRAGRFQEAIELSRQAYAMKRAPVLLFNLARAYEGLGDLPNAIRSYSDYLEADPTVKDRGAIETRIVTLRRQIDERDALRREREAAIAREVASRSQRPRRSPSAAPWIVAGAGGAGLVTGAVFGILATSRHDAATHAPQVEIAADQSDAKTYASVANVAFVAGALLAVAGVVWGILDVSAARASTSTATVRPRLRQGFAGLEWAGF